MYEQTVTPRFKDTDALGHINNASIATWFEEARRPIFRIFVPDLSPQKWNLILARIEIDYLAQVEYADEVTIKNGLLKIGTSSMTILQRAFQGNTEVARGKSVMVHFDYRANESCPITCAQRDQLSQHLLAEGAGEST